MHHEYSTHYNEDRVLYGDSQSHLQQLLLGNAFDEEESQHEINNFYSVAQYINLDEYQQKVNHQTKNNQQSNNLLELLNEGALLSSSNLTPEKRIDKPSAYFESDCNIDHSIHFSSHEVLLSQQKKVAGAQVKKKSEATKVSSSSAMITTTTTTTTTRNKENQSKSLKTAALFDRPSHWGNSIVAKAAKLPSGSKKSLKTPLTQHQTLAPRPLKPTIARLSESSLSFRPAWLSSTPNQEPAKEHSHMIEETDDAIVDHFRVPPTKPSSNGPSSSLTELAQSSHQRSKSRSTTAKPGSLRWMLSKVIRETESLSTWITNQQIGNDSISLGFHDPRNRAELVIEVQIHRSHGLYSPFTVFSGEIEQYTRRPNVNTAQNKRKVESYGTALIDEEMDHQELSIQPTVPIPSSCLVFCTQEKESDIPKVISNSAWRLYNPACLAMKESEYLPPLLQKIASQIPQPIQYLMITHCPMERI